MSNGQPHFITVDTAHDIIKELYQDGAVFLASPLQRRLSNARFDLRELASKRRRKTTVARRLIALAQSFQSVPNGDPMMAFFSRGTIPLPECTNQLAALQSLMAKEFPQYLAKLDRILVLL